MTLFHLLWNVESQVEEIAWGSHENRPKHNYFLYRLSQTSILLKSFMDWIPFYVSLSHMVHYRAVTELWESELLKCQEYVRVAQNGF